MELLHALMLEKRGFRCYEEESEKPGSHQESNPGHLACATSALNSLCFSSFSMPEAYIYPKLVFSKLSCIDGESGQTEKLGLIMASQRMNCLFLAST